MAESLDKGRQTVVTVGLPVYNGENYLEEAIRSIVNQTHAGWELIIGDNASTDATEDIARHWAHHDQRIQYIRHERNRGAAYNYNFVFKRARGRYLKWQAHDDVCGPRFLEICVAVLDGDPSVALAYPRPLDIDAQGEILGPRDAGLNFAQETPCQRFRAMTSQAHACLAMFGVFRRELFDAGVRHGDYPAADRVLLAEMALYGKLVEVGEDQYFHREHGERYSQKLKQAGFIQQAAWFNSDRQSDGRVYPHWKRLAGYARAINSSQISVTERLCAVRHLARWSLGMSGELLKDLVR